MGNTIVEVKDDDHREKLEDQAAYHKSKAVTKYRVTIV